VRAGRGLRCNKLRFGTVLSVREIHQCLARQCSTNVCSNNLKQLAIGLHNFHDTRRGLPPLVLGPERASAFTLMLPYCEQQPMYDALDVRNGDLNGGIGAYLGAPMVDNWNLLSSSEQNAAGSLMYLQCPMRRQGIQISLSQEMPGGTSDYAVVMMTKSGKKNDWVNYYDPCKPEHIDHISSTLRVGKVDGCPSPTNENYRRAASRDTMARILDGTSNTIVFGEKHIRPGEFGRCCGDTFDKGADGTWLFAGGNNRQYTIARSAYYPFTREPTDFNGQDGRADGGPLNDFGFGSHHEEVVLMCRGDGSVVDLSKTTDVEMLRTISIVDDGIKEYPEGF
jgi:hypothetical protein